MDKLFFECNLLEANINLKDYDYSYHKIEDGWRIYIRKNINFYDISSWTTIETLDEIPEALQRIMKKIKHKEKLYRKKEFKNKIIKFLFAIKLPFMAKLYVKYLYHSIN